MARSRVRLDNRGIGEVLRSAPVASVIQGFARSVETNVRAAETVVRNNMPTDVRFGETDRTKAYVTIVHPAGLRAQAKYGVLTRAASSAGLEVKSR